MAKQNKQNFEGKKQKTYTIEALEYIAKIADGGCRDAISLAEKCLAYNTDLTVSNVVSALGTVDYDTMIQLTDLTKDARLKEVISLLEDVHMQGKDIKLFVKQYVRFLLDVQKYSLGCDWKYLSIPKTKAYQNWINSNEPEDYERLLDMLDVMVRLNSDIKWSSSALYDIESTFVLFMEGKK